MYLKKGRVVGVMVNPEKLLSVMRLDDPYGTGRN